MELPVRHPEPAEMSEADSLLGALVGAVRAGDAEGYCLAITPHIRDSFALQNVLLVAVQTVCGSLDVIGTLAGDDGHAIVAGLLGREGL